MSFLEENERVEADDGYKGEHPMHVKCPAGFCNPQETLFMQQRIRNRQETVNMRLKKWGCLKQPWRHNIMIHGDAFRACAVLLQVSISSGERLFQSGYRDPPYN